MAHSSCWNLVSLLCSSLSHGNVGKIACHVSQRSRPKGWDLRPRPAAKTVQAFRTKWFQWHFKIILYHDLFKSLKLRKNSVPLHLQVVETSWFFCALYWVMKTLVKMHVLSAEGRGPKAETWGHDLRQKWPRLSELTHVGGLGQNRPDFGPILTINASPIKGNECLAPKLPRMRDGAFFGPKSPQNWSDFGPTNAT
jgi:hypothetical protein